MAPAIVATGLSRTFGSVVAVDGVSITVASGEVFGLLGPDGAGKTTLLRMLVGILDPTAGEAQVAGIDVGAAPDAVKAVTGYAPQRFALYDDLTVLENLRFMAELYGVPPSAIAPRIERLLEFSRLAPFADHLAEHLSGGMKQKLSLACTLIHEPAVLLLDEPTTGVDPVSRREFWQILYDLNRAGITVMVATPYMDEAERCSRVALMHRGRLLTVDTPAAVKARLRGTLLEVVASPRRAALAAARAVPGVLECNVFGESVHVLVADAAAEARVRDALPRAGLAVAEVRTIDPSLEDVFVSLLRDEPRGG